MDALTEEVTGPCVSIFLPTHEVTQHTTEDRIRLKNLKVEAFDALLARQVRRPDAEALIAPIDNLLAEESVANFWPYLSDGLAIFSSPNYYATFRLPIRFEPSARVSHRFVVKPLFPLFSDDGTFSILAVSRNAVRLFEGTRNSVREVDLEHLPRSMSETLKIRQRPNLSPSGPLQGQEGQKELYRQFFHQVDRVIRPWLEARKAPLVLAGVDSVVPIYRKASSYRRIVDGAIHGSPEELRPEQLHDKAWPLVEPLFLNTRKEAIHKYESQVGAGRTSDDLSAILCAALDGRVETLFVRGSAEVFGKFDYSTRSTVLSSADEPGTIDLVARTARLTHQHGGKVYVGEPPNTPDVASVAAVYRY